MKKWILHIKIAFRETFRDPMFTLLAFLIFLLLVAFNIGVINYRLYLNFPRLDVIIKVFLGTFLTLPIHSIILLFVASTLTGILVSLLVFHVKNMKELNKSYGTGSLGAVLGIIAPACASCGIGIVAVLGLTGFIGSLPFAGLEIGSLGIFLLAWAIFSLSSKISIKTCKIKEDNLKKLISVKEVKNE